MTATLSVTIGSDLSSATLRGRRWQMTCPISDLGRWLAFYQGLRDRENGRFARFYAPAVAAIEAALKLVNTTTPNPDITNIREEREAFPAGNGRMGNQGARGDNPE